MQIEAKQALTIIVYTISGTGGAAWKVRVGDSPNLADAYWEHTGAGDTTFNTGLFGLGTHYAFLVVAGTVTATASWNEQAVAYPVTPPLPPPPPPPPPANSGSGDGERVGYCTLKAFTAFQQTWYRVMHDDGETIVSGVDFASAKYKAGKSDRCKQAPAVAPPSAAAPGPEAIADAVAAKLAPVTGGLKQDTTSLLETAGTTLAVGTINYNMLGWIRNSALPALQETANNIYGRLESVPARIIEFRNTVLGRIDDVKISLANLPRFDVSADIVAPITGAMPSLGKIHGWIDNFSWPAWDTVIVQPISNVIDTKISAMFGIDPALPFWDELEKKIIALAIRSVDAILDAVIPDPPQEE